MFDKLGRIEERFEELNRRLSDPEIVKDMDLLMKLSREQSEIKPIVNKFRITGRC